MSVALFLRHGKASAFSSSAGYDELSPLGVEQSEQFGEWLARDDRMPLDAVFVGPRKRHAQTLDAVKRLLASKGVALPEATLLPELDEHHGISVVFKLLPSLGAEDPRLGEIVAKMARGEPPSPDDVLAAFRRITRRWVVGEVGHDEVESWAAFRTRVVRGLDRIADIGRGKTALAITSAGTVAAAAAESLDVRDEQRVLDLSFALYNASLTELDFLGRGGPGWALRTFNSTAHLERRLITSV
jgi:broad specificity phosphatase PhoE